MVESSRSGLPNRKGSVNAIREQPRLADGDEDGDGDGDACILYASVDLGISTRGGIEEELTY